MLIHHCLLVVCDMSIVRSPSGVAHPPSGAGKTRLPTRVIAGKMRAYSTSERSEVGFSPLLAVPIHPGDANEDNRVSFLAHCHLRGS